MEIERYVTAWGFPGLRWWDTISNMRGTPMNPMPSIRSHKVERRLWINGDGVQMLGLDAGEPGVVGHWNELEHLVLGTSRIDLSPQNLRLLQLNRLQWVEHQIIEAHFRDGTVNRVAQSAISEGEMRRVHEAISRAFVEQRPRGSFEPPEGGRAMPGEASIEATVEPLESGEENKTKTNVSGKEFQTMGIWHELPIPSVEWAEPMTTGGLFGSSKYHLVRRLLYVGRGFREGRRSLSFNTYRPDGKVITVQADFGLLKGFRLVDSREVKFPPRYQPMDGVRPGWTIIADFRYGYFIPLTCTTCERGRVEALRQFFSDAVFMPLVGKHLSDEDLGLPPRPEQS